MKKGIIMKKVIKKKLEETKQHAFEKKVLQREKAKGAPRVGEFYKENVFCWKISILDRFE